MVPGPIDIENAAEAVDCPIRRDLALLAAGLDTRFLKAGTSLATAVEQIDRVIGGLDGIVSALDEQTAGAAVADLRRVAEDLTALPIRQTDRAAQMAEVADVARTLNDQVLEMHETLRVLSIYGMNIKIAASGEAQFVRFVDGMTVKLDACDLHLRGFMDRLRELATAIASVQQADRLLAAESGKVVPEVPARLAGDAEDLAAHLGGISTLARKVSAIARSVQGKIAVVLGALQVGDSTRQRLEHIVSALQLAEVSPGDGPPDPIVTGHVDRLLAAQLEAAMADFTREIAAMLASLADLAPDAGGLLELIAEQGDGGTRSFLARLDLDITDVERLTARLRDADGRARTMTGIISSTVAELSEGLAGVHRIRVDVQDIATNTRLLCQRHGSVGRAVSVIATEVDVYAGRLSGPTTSIAQAISRLGSIEDSARGPDEEDSRDIGETLADVLAVVRRACQRTEQVLSEGGDDTRSLIDLLAHTRAELSGELTSSDVMEAAARTLSLRSPSTALAESAEAPLRALLPQIARLYTMASEREVHAAFLLPGMETVAAASPSAEEDEDDDGLF